MPTYQQMDSFFDEIEKLAAPGFGDVNPKAFSGSGNAGPGPGTGGGFSAPMKSVGMSRTYTKQKPKMNRSGSSAFRSSPFGSPPRGSSALGSIRARRDKLIGSVNSARATAKKKGQSSAFTPSLQKREVSQFVPSPQQRTVSPFPKPNKGATWGSMTPFGR